MFLFYFYLTGYIFFTLLHFVLTGQKRKAAFYSLRSLILFSAFLLHGDSIQKPFIHSDFLLQVKEFEFLYGKKLENVSISYGNFLGSSVVGICWSYSKTGNWYKGKFIKIDEGYWKESSNATREILLFHELGHCELNRDHEDEFVTLIIDNREVFMSKTIMNSYIIDEKKYRENREYYIKELFNKIN